MSKSLDKVSQGGHEILRFPLFCKAKICAYMMKKCILVLSILISNYALSWDTVECRGQQHDRVLALNELGLRVLAFIRDNGKLPDLCRNHFLNRDQLIPKELKSYLVCGGSENDSVGYWCWKDHSNIKKVQEVCKFTLSTGNMECRNLVATYDRERN
ncbi:hypothetical protein FKG94_18095 [Exilibacterium tricleocarpae]|uniref:Uncharacterized protein n=1 Tax=Exilibacterium tricleocarpae TaxID=2591008 RepID=A0A545T5W4_9GAMM|nr:hypothetical protein [Exilibacterium tricleocarpae]TQV72609.1 hypothetical protein FKG94_18095 [Exilibacterium tricleocarpae]